MKLFRFAAVFILVALPLFTESSRWRYVGPDSASIDGSSFWFGPTLVADRMNPNILFARTGGIAGCCAAEKLYRSTDQGATWQDCHLKDVLQAVVHPVTSKVFATTRRPNGGGRLWKSNDHGKNFTLISSGDFFFHRLFLHPSDPSILFAFDTYSLIQSSDGGIHWAVVQTLPFLPLDERERYAFHDLLFSPFNPKVIYLSAVYTRDDYVNYTTKFLFLASTNLGRTWKQLSNNQITRFHFDPLYPDRAFGTGAEKIYRLNRRSGWIPYSTVDFNISSLISIPGDPQRMIAHDYAYPQSDVYESLDEGRTWRKRALDFKDRLTSPVSIQNRQVPLLGGTDGAGIFRLDQGNKWTPSSRGLKEANITSIAASGSSIYVTNYERYFYRKSGNAGWKFSAFQRSWPQEVVADPGDPKRLYLIYADNRPNGWSVGVSVDGGEKWTRLGPFTGVFIDPKDRNILYFVNFGQLFKSVDGGATQQRLPNDVNAFRIVIDEHRPETLFFLVSGGLLKTTDDGKTIQRADEGIRPEKVTSIAPLTRPDNYLAYTSKGNIYQTSNGARSWQKISRAPCGGLARKCSGQIYAADDKHFFLVAQSKLFETQNGGRTWNDLTSQFGPNVEVNMLTDPRRSPLFVATNRGVFQTP